MNKKIFIAILCVLINILLYKFIAVPYSGNAKVMGLYFILIAILGIGTCYLLHRKDDLG